MNDLRFEGIILLSPMVVEFFLKLKGNFKGQCFAEDVVDGGLIYNSRTESLTHLAMKNFRLTEKSLVFLFISFEVLIGILVIIFTHINYL